MVAVVPQPMLARLESKLPRGAQWRYEPKLDGFRGLLWRRTETVVELLSRNMRDLSPWFPEIVGAGRASNENQARTEAKGMPGGTSIGVRDMRTGPATNRSPVTQHYLKSSF